MSGRSNTKRTTKGGVDYGSAFEELDQEANSRNDARFSIDGASRAERASELVNKIPSAFSTPAAAAAVSTNPVATAASEPAKEVPLFDPNSFVIGLEYRVPLGLIDQNTWGARVYYKVEDIDRISKSFDKSESEDEKQHVAVNGFVKPDGRVELIDGGTRLRAGRSSGITTLRVKLERPPANAREQFKRSKDLNDERSEHTALDLAVQFRRMLDEKVYESQDELARDLTDRKGVELTKSAVSMYLRIAKIPDRLRRKMVEDEQTSAFTIAYEISALFNQPDYESRQDHYDKLAEDVIREIKESKLGKQQVIALVKAKLDGPRSRTRPEATNLRYAGTQGTLKVFEGRGQLDFSIRGLSAEDLGKLKQSIEKICSAPGPATP